MNNEELKEYLHNVSQLELSAYMQARALQSIKRQISALKDYDPIPYRDYKKYNDSLEKNLMVSHIMIIIFIVLYLVIVTKIIKFFEIPFSLMTFLIGYGLFFIMVIPGWYLGTKEVKEKLKWREEGREEVDRYNAEAKRKNEMMSKRIPLQIRMLEPQQRAMYQRAKKTKALLDQYYSLNIIHKDFRGLIPVCTMYGYFDWGVCSELEGPHGAYKQYLNDSKLGIIISKLNEISDKLDDLRDDINQAQRKLIMGIREMNQKVNSLNKSMTIGIKKMDDISRNTELTAYYAKIDAEYSALNTWLLMSK